MLTRAGISVRAQATRSWVSLQERRGQFPVLAARLEARFGLTLIDEPRQVTGEQIAVLGVGAGTWFATSNAPGAEFTARLREVVADAASITDMSAAFVMLRLTGPRIRATLAKLVPVDVHPRAFQVSGVARTVAAHVPVLLWRCEDEGGDAVFELAVPRSYAASACHALLGSAAEYGVDFEATAQPGLQGHIERLYAGRGRPPSPSASSLGL